MYFAHVFVHDPLPYVRNWRRILTAIAHVHHSLQKVLTRVNTYTGVAYKDDPTIFAWELMNEPHCETDPSGNTIAV